MFWKKLLFARVSRHFLTKAGSRQRSSAVIEPASIFNQDDYTARYSGYVERYNTAKTNIEALEQERTLRLARVDAFDAFIRAVKDVHTALPEFDDRLWLKTIDTVTVKDDGKLVFRFQNGMEIEG